MKRVTRHTILRFANDVTRQWCSEVHHFCPDVPKILVGCKKDLRFDQKTIEELRKTSQQPVTPEQVSRIRMRPLNGPPRGGIGLSTFGKRTLTRYGNRPQRLPTTSRPPSTLSARPRPTRVSARCSNSRHGRLSSRRPGKRRASVSSPKRRRITNNRLHGCQPLLSDMDHFGNRTPVTMGSLALEREIEFLTLLFPAGVRNAEW
jgi:hypothetical protein